MRNRVLKAHRLVFHLTLGSRVIKKKRKIRVPGPLLRVKSREMKVSPYDKRCLRERLHFLGFAGSILCRLRGNRGSSLIRNRIPYDPTVGASSERADYCFAWTWCVASPGGGEGGGFRGVDQEDAVG